MEKQSYYIIKVDNLFPDHEHGLYCIRFRITPPQNKKFFLKVPFLREFIADYYEINGDSEKIFFSDEKRNFFIWWGWKKVEKWIEDGLPSLENKELLVDDTQEDIDWAKNIAKNIDLEICKKLDSEDGYPYPATPGMGF